MAVYREYSLRARVGGRTSTRPVELITVAFTDATSRSYDPKDHVFPVSGDTVQTLDRGVLTVDSTVTGGASAAAGLEKDTGPDRARV